MSGLDTQRRSFSGHRLGAVLDDVGGRTRPDYLPDIVAQAGRTRQRPAWTVLERWLPMDIAVRRQGVPRAVIALAVLLLLLALIATIGFVGSRPTPSPLGAASNGLIAYATGNDIVAAQPDGSGRRTLVSGIGHGGLAFSPDGRRLAYWSQTGAGGTIDLVIVNADGSNPVTVSTGVGEVTSPSPAWSPDGTKIAYSARVAQPGDPVCVGQGYQNGDFCTSRLFLAAVDGSGARQIGSPAMDARSPDWSPDGKTIAFGGGNATPGFGVHLYLMDADGTNVRQLSDVVGTDWAFVRVDWSRDGSKIVGQASAAGNLSEWDIWIIPVDGSAPTDVGAHVGGDEVLPTWAPDRDALTWWADGIVLLEDGAEPVVLPVPDAGFSVWSPDGKSILTSTNEGAVVVDLKGAVQQRLAGSTAWVAWQPLFE